MSEEPIYKTFRKRSKELWICTGCTNFKIQISPGKYYKKPAAAKQKALEADADTHIAETHKDFRG